MTDKPETPNQEPASQPASQPVASVKAASILPPTNRPAINQNVKQPEKEKVVDPTLANLIEQSKIRNAELARESSKEVVVPTDHAHKLLQIKSALADSGADSMQQSKTYDRIKEILGW